MLTVAEIYSERKVIQIFSLKKCKFKTKAYGIRQTQSLEDELISQTPEL